MQNNPAPCTTSAQIQCLADGPQGSFTQPVVAAMHLERVSPRRADLNLTFWVDETCFPSGPTVNIHRDNAQALGDKTGNGGRAINACD